jgi:plastocyanin
MKKTLIIGLLVMAILISGCVTTTPTPTPTMTATPTATTIETATATATPATTAPSTNMVSVNIQNFNFVPATVSVTKGTTVTWTNRDILSRTL